jgi:hypothetical protein
MDVNPNVQEFHSEIRRVPKSPPREIWIERFHGAERKFTALRRLLMATVE